MVDLVEDRAVSEVCEGGMKGCGNPKWMKKLSDSQSEVLDGWSDSGQPQEEEEEEMAFVADGDAENEYQMSMDGAEDLQSGHGDAPMIVLEVY